MTTRIVECSILVGKHAQHLEKKMTGVAKSTGAAFLSPWKFECRQCKAAFGGTEIDAAVDLKTVSCSNCYSDLVFMKAIRVQIPEDWEVNGSDGPEGDAAADAMRKGKGCP